MEPSRIPPCVLCIGLWMLAACSDEAAGDAVNPVVVPPPAMPAAPAAPATDSLPQPSTADEPTGVPTADPADGVPTDGAAGGPAEPPQMPASDQPDAFEPSEPEPGDEEPDEPPVEPEPQPVAGCETTAGDERVDATIVVGPGETFDGQCRRYIAGPAVGDGSQSEGQDPVFRLEDGARLLNVVLGAPAADGIHTYGDVTLSNITWEDIGEDALTIKDPGTVELDGGAAYDGSDKVFQINAASTFRVSNFRADNAGKFIRQNGGTGFTVHVFIESCDISNMDEAIFRTDSNSSSVTMSNTRYSNIGDSGDELWYDVNPANITESDNTQY